MTADLLIAGAAVIGGAILLAALLDRGKDDDENDWEP